ncbi:MAG: hypothetical protein Q8K59_03015 [Nitrosomonas sp.]|nr:hypothetical protein [Nitrosomonas sp.]
MTGKKDGSLRRRRVGEETTAMEKAKKKEREQFWNNKGEKHGCQVLAEDNIACQRPVASSSSACERTERPLGDI